MSETECAILLVHHDTKPVPGKPDERPRPHRASGGAIFSISDAPIHVERLDDRQTRLVPTAYKFSGDPRAFAYTFTRNDGPEVDWIRLVGQEAAGEAITLRGRVLNFVGDHPKASASAVTKGLKARKENVLQTLRVLHKDGLVDCEEGDRGQLWFLKHTPTVSPSESVEAADRSPVPPYRGDRSADRTSPSTPTSADHPWAEV